MFRSIRVLMCAWNSYKCHFIFQEFEKNIYNVDSEPNEKVIKIENRWYDSQEWINFCRFISGQYPQMYNKIIQIFFGYKVSNVMFQSNQIKRNLPL